MATLFDRAAALRSAIEASDIAVTWRTPDDLTRLSIEAMAASLGTARFTAHSSSHLTGLAPGRCHDGRMDSWKVRGASGFSFDAGSDPVEVLRTVRGTVDGFAAETPAVVGQDVRLRSERSFVGELTMVTASFGAADEIMRRLCARIADRFAGGVVEQETELIPA